MNYGFSLSSLSTLYYCDIDCEGLTEVFTCMRCVGQGRLRGTRRWEEEVES